MLKMALSAMIKLEYPWIQIVIWITPTVNELFLMSLLSTYFQKVYNGQIYDQYPHSCDPLKKLYFILIKGGGGGGWYPY